MVTMTASAFDLEALVLRGIEFVVAERFVVSLVLFGCGPKEYSSDPSENASSVLSSSLVLVSESLYFRENLALLDRVFGEG